MDGEWYRMDAAQVLGHHGTDAERGLEADEAVGRLVRYGPNELRERGVRTRRAILREQLTGVMTLVLLAAAFASVVLGDLLDAAAIVAIVVLNATLGFIQEYRAERSIAALKRLAVPTVRVRRGGSVVEVSARDVVPGDLVLLVAGDLVPADGRVVESADLRVQEATLTGESEPVEKRAALVFETERAVGDQGNMAFMGTAVVYGRGTMVVTATGMSTELGRVAELIQSVTAEKTPLQRRLDRLGRVLAVAASAITAVVFALGLLRGEDVKQMLLAAVSLAVAAIPEALTAVVTIALALGAQRMLRRRALIRRLPAVETLGSVTVICSDKTGTLTQNRMTVTALDIADHSVELTQGPDGGFRLPEPVGRQEEGWHVLPTLDLLLVGGALCNDSSLETVPVRGESDGSRAEFRAVGDPTEGALVVAAADFGIMKDDLDVLLPRVAELPFDSVRKRMTTVHRVPGPSVEVPESLRHVWARRHGAGEVPPSFVAFTKGALDSLLSVSTAVWVGRGIEPLDDDTRRRVQEAHDALASRGMRVLAVALRAFDGPPAAADLRAVEQDLVLVGLFGLSDPPRPEVTEAVATCRRAGIRPVMITGDHPLTALHVARQVGISDGEAFVSGREIEELSDDELVLVAADVPVFARVSPEHKLRLVQALQAQGQVVAMTGDGVNDAPALKRADIGVAMGITGTDVSREAAAMVLLDDNFATIVSAVEEGRVIFDNIRKFIAYLLSCNAGELAVMLVGPFLGLPLPLLPLQILWMNLVTDGLPALALGVEPAERDVMNRPPHPPRESVFGGRTVPFIVTFGLLTSAVSLAVAAVAYHRGDEGWQTLLFTTLIFSQLALAGEVRSETATLFSRSSISNPYMVGALIVTGVLQLVVVYAPGLRDVFDTRPLSAGALGVAVGAAAAIAVAVEAWKVGIRLTGRRTA